MKYQRLADKMKELVDISRKVEDDTEYIQEHLSLCTVFECNTLELYKTIQQFAKKNIILRRKSLKRNPCSTPESREIKESIYEESS